jgi:hypothetical protein
MCELSVDGVIESFILRSGKRVRISTQLVYAPTDRHLWSEAYERDLGDVLKLQAEVAEAITQQIRLKLTPEQLARLHQARPVGPEAFEDYIMAGNFARCRTNMRGSGKPRFISRKLFRRIPIS